MLTLSPCLHANKLYGCIGNELIKGPYRIASTANARDDDIGKFSRRLLHLRLDFAPNNLLIIAYDGRERVRAKA